MSFGNLLSKLVTSTSTQYIKYRDEVRTGVGIRLRNKLRALAYAKLENATGSRKGGSLSVY